MSKAGFCSECPEKEKPIKYTMTPVTASLQDEFNWMYRAKGSVTHLKILQVVQLYGA